MIDTNLDLALFLRAAGIVEEIHQMFTEAREAKLPDIRSKVGSRFEARVFKLWIQISPISLEHPDPPEEKITRIPLDEVGADRVMREIINAATKKGT